MEPDARIVRIARRAAQLCAVVVGGPALMVAIAWLLGEWTFATIGPEYKPMAPGTAWLFVLVSGALFIRSRWPDGRATKAAVGTAVAITAATGVLTGMALRFRFALPLEVWMGRTTAMVGGLPVVQMSPVTAATLVAAALALGATIGAPGRQSLLHHFAAALAVVVLFTGLMLTLTYVMGGPLFYAVGHIPMAPQTALGFTVLGVGLLLVVEPGTWLPRLFVGEPEDRATSQLRRSERLMVAAFVALIAGIGTMGLTYARYRLANAGQQVRTELEAIADLKVQQVVRWRHERLDDATFAVNAGFLARAVDALLNDPSSETTRAELLHWLDTLREVADYEEVALFDAHGNLLLSAPPRAGPPSLEERRDVTEGFRQGHPVMSDLHRGDTPTGTHLAITAPIFAPPNGPAATQSPTPQPIALLLLQVDATRFLYPLLQSWPMPSKTAETLLVRREGDSVLFLNELRHQKGTALTLRLPMTRPLLPAATAVEGKSETLEGVDYRGARVLAVTRPVPDSPWSMVAKVDQEEIYAPIRERAWSISLVLVALTLAVALGISRLWRQRHEEFLSQQLAAARERTALAERVAHLMRSANDAIMLTDENWRIIEANDRALETYGYTLAELQERQMADLRAPEHRGGFPQVAERLKAEGHGVFEGLHQRKDGTTFPAEVSVRLAESGGVPYTLGIVRDVTERKEAEARQRLALGALELLNRAGDVSALSSELLRLIKNSTGFDAVGLRLRQGDDFPYYEQSGFADDFVQEENFLCAKGEDGHIMRDAAGHPVLECTCGLVLSGRTDPSMPCFTQDGSFWTNTSAELLALAPEDDSRAHPRNRCIHAGYQSVALIPLRSGDETIGLLQLNDRRAGRFTPELVRFFEGLGASIGIAVKHKQAEEAVRESEERYRQIVELSPEAIAVHREGRIVFVNRAAVRLAGAKNADELLGRSAFDIVHPDDRARAVQRVRLSLDTGTPAPLIEQKFVRLDGAVIDAEIRSQLVSYQGKPAVQVLIRDVTARKRAEAEQAALLGIAKDIAGLVDLNEILTRVHQRVAAVLPCDRVGTYCWDGTRKTYRALLWHGVPPVLASDAVVLEFHSGQPVTERLLAGETVLINDVAGQSLVPLEILRHFGLMAVLVVPLVVRGRRIGALAALNAEGGSPFDPRQVRLFEGIAQHVGVAIEAADLYRAQEEESAVAGALARVGQEMISSLNDPMLLNRLCQLTTEVMGCDRSGTWLWDGREDVFVPVASYGDSAELWETIRLVRFGRSALTPQLEGMEREGIFNVKVADLPESEAKAAARAYGMTVGLMVPLRRGGELVGFHTADYHGREEELGERHERIARGIGHLASLALENVRLIEELERANRLKADFVATMSHELRTPLNIIMGYTDLLLDGGFGAMTAEQLDTLRRVEKSAQGLLQLITATLDLSRLDTGQVRLDVKPIALTGFVSELDAEISGLREKPDVDFVWDLAPALPQLHSDAAKLKVVLKNLIGNALKYTSSGAVTVRLRGRNGGVEITVADTGAGIAPEILPVIFEPFRQGEPALTRKYGGVGLGLYIVRRLLDALGGTIDVESTVGQGSTFRVWVPSRAAA